VSGVSEKQRMRDALRLTERNLCSLIGARDDLGLSHDGMVIHNLLVTWRNACRRALGYSNAVERECICPQCGIRHGIHHKPADF